MSLFEAVKNKANELEVDQINSLIKHLSRTKKRMISQSSQRETALQQINEAFSREYQF